MVSRLALDQLRSTRVRRESYVGEWLPEPLVASADDDPAREAEMADSLSLALMVLPESLSAEQRAAFLLREVFDEDARAAAFAHHLRGLRARWTVRLRVLLVFQTLSCFSCTRTCIVVPARMCRCQRGPALNVLSPL